MDQAFNIIEYMSGLTGFALDETIYRRIAVERGLEEVEYYGDLTERDKDLLTADILYAVLLSPSTIPSFQHQHGQFSMSIGQQQIRDKDALLRWMLRLYRKWKDPKGDMFDVPCLEWHY